MRVINLITFFTIAKLTAADSVVCRARTVTGTECLASVEAGAFGQCPGGYKKESVTAPGQVKGFYCVRTCTPDEQRDCDADGCQSYSDACRPEQPISCQLAVNYCKGVVSDYICSNAPNYRKCAINNLCQEYGAACCPPGEKMDTYIEQIVNIFENAQNMTRTIQLASCGTNSAENSDALVQAYLAAGGRQFPGSINDYCSGTKTYHSFLNRTGGNPDDIESIILNNQQICENNGGIFSFKNRN